MRVIPPVDLQYSLPSYPNDHQSKHLTVSINNAQNILRFMESLKNDKIRKKNGNKDSLVTLNPQRIIQRTCLFKLTPSNTHYKTTAPASHLGVGRAGSSYQRLRMGSKHSMLLMVSLQLNMSSLTKNWRPPITYSSPFTLTEHGAVRFWFMSGMVSQTF